MSSSRPVVIVAATVERARPYVAVLRSVGCEETVVLTAETSTADHGVAAVESAGGLVLAGGADVEPQRYQTAPLADAGLELVPERDELEFRVLDAARNRSIPVWGICRGLQVINVFLGGTLWQDLPRERPGNIVHDPSGPHDHLAHSLTVLEPSTALGQRLAAGEVLVNSRHHQGVRQLASALRAVAAAPDGLVEAVTLAEDHQGWWLRAVQWHPENLVDLPVQRRLWEDFAAARRSTDGARG